MKKLMTLMTVLLALSAPKAVQAFDDLLPEGLYVGAFGAVDFPHVKKHHSHSSDASGSIHNKLKTGYFFSGALGYRFCEGLRAELETGFHHNKKKKHHNSTSGDFNRQGGNANTWSVLVNGLYDFQTCWCLKPFLGAGIGYSSTNLKRGHFGGNDGSSSSASNGGCNDCGNEESSGSSSSSSSHHKRRKTGFAWQLIAGVAYPLCDGWDVSLQYRYFNSAVRRLHNNDVGIGLAYTF